MHEAPDDVETKAGPCRVAPARRIEANELLEEARRFSRFKADTAILHGDLDGAAVTPAGHRHNAALHGRDRRNGVFNQIAQYPVRRDGIGEEFEVFRNIDRESDVLALGDVFDVGEHMTHGLCDADTLPVQMNPTTVEARAVENLRHHIFHAAQVVEHPVGKLLKTLGRKLTAQHRLQGKLKAGERRLELVRHHREEVVLLAADLGLTRQAAPENRDTGRKNQKKEAAFPGVLVGAAAFRFLDLK